MKRWSGCLMMSVLLVVCAGCEGEKTRGDLALDSSTFDDSVASSPPVQDRELAPSIEARESGLIVHEWGTFTSMQSSSGRVLEGLHHEDEALPPFVYGRGPGFLFGNSKSMEMLPEPVTQKLETPVLYFYSDQPTTVKVEVGFPQGIISEWYPKASSFAPDIGAVERMAEGSMRWDVEVLHKTPDLIEVSPQDIWAPSRQVASDPLKVGEEWERFIFYRGLGRFETPLRVLPRDDTHFTITNDSPDTIPASFLLHVHEGGGRVVPLGSLAPGDNEVSAPSPKEIDIDNYVEVASELLVTSLVETGLYRDEAVAMANTWSRSYFHQHGLRILYVVPRTWTDALLPISIEPAPKELVRTMVGRIEVLTPQSEHELMERIDRAVTREETFRLAELGRFAEPRLRRALDMCEEPAQRAVIESLLIQAQWSSDL